MQPVEMLRVFPRENGSVAAEFGLVLPLILLLTIGGIGLGSMMFAGVSLHYATEDAARCASVKTTVCPDQTALTTYATAKYKGPTLASMTFTLTAAASGTCGNQVVGAGTYQLRTGMGTVSVPMSATACYPA